MKRSALLRSRRFPLAPPTWPAGVEHPAVERRTGVDFDTGWARRYPARFARAGLVDFVLRPGLRLLTSPRVDGVDRLDGLGGPVIFAANHHSHLDTPVLLSCLPDRWRHRTVVAAASDYFFTSRARGALSALAFGAIPISRTAVSRRSAELAEALLREGWSLLIFPEGGRSPDGWGQVFRGGAGYLSVRTGRPVVPIHLEGTGRLMPRGARRPRPGRVHVTFGAPLRPAPGDDARRFTARIEHAVAVLGDEQATDWWSARRRAAQGGTPVLTGPGVAVWRRAWALRRDERRLDTGIRWPG